MYNFGSLQHYFEIITSLRGQTMQNANKPRRGDGREAFRAADKQGSPHRPIYHYRQPTTSMVSIHCALCTVQGWGRACTDAADAARVRTELGMTDG